MDSPAVLVASAPITDVTGIWQRHASATIDPERVLDGYAAYGRWGTRDGFPVLYLGQPTDSVIVEAYRHLVDPVEDPAMRGQISPRVLVSCQIAVTNVLDLRSPGARLQVGITLEQLLADVNNRAAYEACQEISQIAHQLGRHGIIAPAATGRGETLALFPDRLPVSERPRRSANDTYWATLPADPREAKAPRALRVVRNPETNS
jgi:hypothetical protein